MSKRISIFLTVICLAVCFIFAGAAFAAPVDDTLKQASETLQKGNVNEAYNLLNKAAKDFPDNGDVFFSRGEVNLIIKKDAQAFADFDKAISLEQNKGVANLSVGFAAARFGKYDKAIAYLDTAATLIPDTAEVYLTRANVKYALKDAAGAKTDLDKAIELNGKMTQAYFDRGVLALQSNDLDSADKDFKKAVALDKNKANANLAIGMAYARTPNFALAIPYLSKSIELQPHAQAYFIRADVYTANKEYAKAIADCDKAIGLDSNFFPAYLQRGAAHFRAGSADKALADFSKAVELNPNAAIAHMNRGYANAQLGKKDAAKADFKKAAELDKNLAQSIPAEYK